MTSSTTTRRRLLGAFLGLVLGTLAATAAAFAQEHHESEGGEAPATPVPWNDMIEALVNFAVFGGLLYYFARKPVKDMLERRTRTIASQLEEAAELRRQAEERLDEYQTKLDKFDQEREEIIEGYKREAAKDGESIIAAAKQQAERMKTDAKLAIEYELKHAQVRLRERIVDEAVKRARLAIGVKLDKAADKELVERYTAALGQLAEQQAE